MATRVTSYPTTKALSEGRSVPFSWDGGCAPALLWAPYGNATSHAYLLILLGGSNSTARKVLGAPPEAPTAMATTLADAIRFGELPRDLLVAAVGSDAYSSATDIGTSVSDLPNATLRVEALADAIGQTVLDGMVEPARRIMVGVSYGATVAWSLLASNPHFADTWVLLSGLPWNGTYMARNRSWEADIMARALRQNERAEILVATGGSPVDVERTLCVGMMEVIEQLGGAYPDVSGRVTPHVRLVGRHEDADLAIELGDVLERLPYHRKFDVPVRPSPL